MRHLQSKTIRVIADVFQRFDYQRLGPLYCDEGGEAFWNDRREPCQTLGKALAEILMNRLKPGGRSLYVGAGVAELPLLIAEVLELQRQVDAFNLRKDEVAVLNQACKGLPFRITAGDARSARSAYDHLWIVSVLNDPERYPYLSALSYGRANPVTFDPASFAKERVDALTLIDACLSKLRMPGLVMTSVEEIPWIVDWCERKKLQYVVEEEDYPTAIVEDPVCIITVGRDT